MVSLASVADNCWVREIKHLCIDGKAGVCVTLQVAKQIGIADRLAVIRV